MQEIALDNKKGWVEVICGSMFSGKTEELIRRMNRAMIAKQEVIIFKPKVDDRYHEEHVVTHDKKSIPAKAVENANDILGHIKSHQVIGIDEAQFFDDGIVDVVSILAYGGRRVIVAGLDIDFRGRPFGSMPQLLAIAEYVKKARAICMQCGNLAWYSHRIVDEDATVLVGEKESYEARCRGCYT